MTGTVKHARLESRTARSRLKRGRQPHWQALEPGRVHLGWQCWKGDAAGRWVLRRYIGNRKYRTTALGLADGAAEANGIQVLSFEQAAAKARAMVANPNGGKIERLTVRQALSRYIEYKRERGQPVRDIVSRGTVHILPELGDLVVAQLTVEQMRKWLATMAAAPAQRRPKAGRPQFRAAPTTDEGIRARRATANRVLAMLKAALNHAYDEGHVENRDAWARKLKPFRNVEVARVRYLSIAEAERLINASDPDFLPLVRRTRDRRPLRRAGAARGAGLQPGRRHGCHPSEQDRQGSSYRSDRRGHGILPPALCRPRRARTNVCAGLWCTLETQRPGKADDRCSGACTYCTTDHLPRTTSHLGELGGDERRTVDGGGEEPRARRHPNGRKALRPSSAELHCRCDPGWRAALCWCV